MGYIGNSWDNGRKWKLLYGLIWGLLTRPASITSHPAGGLMLEVLDFHASPIMAISQSTWAPVAHGKYKIQPGL